MQLGLNVSFHITVPDDVILIQDSLLFLETRVRIVLVTGGLGPTVDDFTRKVLADTYHRPLVWNEENWQKVQSKLQSRGVQIRSLHRQQCEYPQGSETLANGVGIADGFAFKTDHFWVYALPGPPKELENIWTHHLRSRLESFVPEELRWIQSIWTVTGLPESEVAAKINQALGEHAVRVLYRVHSPFVDVKLLYQKQQEAFHLQLGQTIAETLGPWLKKNEDSK
jgi:molybdopterin-biosynthesis enzyme MoeA-like protein